MRERKKAIIQILLTLVVVFISHFYLQLSQNNFSWSLAFKFAFQWHQQKFFLSSLVLLVLLSWLISLLGSWLSGVLVYSLSLLLLGFANYQKMALRAEPIYPDDFKMLTELQLLKDILGWPLFLLCLFSLGFVLGLSLYSLYRSFYLTKGQQLLRGGFLLMTSLVLLYITQFNQPSNLLRKQYDRTALWIPYSQKMNYYNTGFVAGFMYNLQVEPMTEPADYSQEKITQIVETYQKKAQENNKDLSDSVAPNIVYVMSESFSNPLHLQGVTASEKPLATYQKLAAGTFSGQMLSQNYGGGTANIEFEALTSFSMEPFNSQLTTPYTMLVPKMKELPSLVSQLKKEGYQATAIHPYNTSMYKRQDVYQVLGFDQFISEKEIQRPKFLAQNEYIADQTAYEEVLKQLAQEEQAQFVHLVTMQTHMPFGNKYPETEIVVEGVENPRVIADYLQDIALASDALADFLKQLPRLKRPTLVVFWGDHLPSIYHEADLAKQPKVASHLTEFLFFDSRGNKSQTEEIISPIYFAPLLKERAHLPQTGFYQLLLALADLLPAFEKEYYYKNGQWQTENPLKGQEKQIYEDYSLLQYDIVSGEQYSLALGFYETEK